MDCDDDDDDDDDDDTSVHYDGACHDDAPSSPIN